MSAVAVVAKAINTSDRILIVSYHCRRCFHLAHSAKVIAKGVKASAY